MLQMIVQADSKILFMLRTEMNKRRIGENGKKGIAQLVSNYVVLCCCG